MNRGVYRSFVISSRVESKYRWGPQDCVPKFVPELNVRKNQNIRATGENHNMRSSLIGLQRRDYLQRGAAQDDFARMKGKFGIIALTGFRLHNEHMKAMSLALNKFLNLKETKGRELGLNAYFRLPDPWHPVTKHPECATMGGGKGKVAYWVTPVKARQIVLEIDGECEFQHVYPGLMNAIKAVEGKQMLAKFPLNYDIMMPVSRDYLEKMYEEERKIEMANEGFWTRREIFAKNMMGIRDDMSRWNHVKGEPICWSRPMHGVGSRMDQTYFGKYR